MKNRFVPYKGLSITDEERAKRSRSFYEFMDQRRSLRMFSDRTVDIKVLHNIIMTASSAPSGAHKQPWVFCLVTDPQTKAKIREAAEKEEYENYNGRMSEEWLEDLKTFDTDWHKEFLEIAPALIVVFKKAYDVIDGKRQKNYYVNESVGLACGFLLSAIHHAGLVALTHTPSPMNFLQRVLHRPENERAFLLIPVGHPSENAEVPNIQRKALDQVMVHYANPSDANLDTEVTTD